MRLLFIIVAVAIVGIIGENGPPRNCTYEDYLSYTRVNVNNIGVNITYYEGYVDQEIVGFGLNVLTYTRRLTKNSICNFDYHADFNGWSVQYMDDHHCAMRITRRMSNDDYFDHCSEPVGDSTTCPGCFQYLTVIELASAPLFSGTLPSGEPQHIVVETTDTDILLVPTQVTSTVTVNVVAPEEYGFLPTVTIALMPGTSTIALTYKGEISYPYSISRQISPPAVIPVDQVNAAVLPLWVHDGDHTWSQVLGQVLSEPQVDCLCNGKFTVSYQVYCLDESLCDMELFHQNEFINAVYDVVYNGCPEHVVEGSASLLLGVNDTETKSSVSVIIANKQYDLVSNLVYTGPPPTSPMQCTYSLQQRHYDGTDGSVYDHIEANPIFNAEFQLQTATANTLRFTVPKELVDPNGEIFIINEHCDLPRPSTKEVGATAAKGTFAFSIVISDEDIDDEKESMKPYAIIGACAGAVVLVAVIAGVVAIAVWSKRNRSYISV